MNQITTVANFLQTADAVHLRDYLLDHAVSMEAGHEAMKYLAEQRPAVASQVLCLMYGIAVYRSADVFPETPAIDANKWFVSALVGSEFDDVMEIPLADTEEAAYALAARHLNLQNTFFGVEAALA